MRLKLRHETRYLYGDPARGAIQILRLTPRNHATQFIRRWRVEIDADCRLDRDEDAYGNILHTFSVEGPIASMRITVDGEIDTGNINPVSRGDDGIGENEFNVVHQAFITADGEFHFDL